MKKIQIVVVVAILAIMGYLYAQPLKGPQKASEPHDNATGANGEHTDVHVDVASVSEPAKAAIGEALAGPITQLEAKLKATSAEGEKTGLEKELAKHWDDVNQPAPAAFYYQAVARKQNTYADWLNAGTRFNDAYKFSKDTTATPAFVANAVEAFTNASKLKPESLEAKTGLGVAYVNGGASPMQGIALLREVVAKDPNNVGANLNLGMFSMKSGQFEKAIDRFKSVIAVKPEFEPYFYLAESYKQIGNKTEAIAAYKKCKELMPDPGFGQRIDEYIKELQN